MDLLCKINRSDPMSLIEFQVDVQGQRTTIKMRRNQPMKSAMKAVCDRWGFNPDEIDHNILFLRNQSKDILTGQDTPSSLELTNNEIITVLLLT